MPSGKYYRAQAQLFARLALVTSDPQIAARYNELALEHLAKADEVDPQATDCGPHATDQDDGSDMDRD
jgi:hypothetical protein